MAAFGVESEAELAVLKQSAFNLICHQVCIRLSNPFFAQVHVLDFFNKTATHEQRHTVAGRKVCMIGTDVRECEFQ